MALQKKSLYQEKPRSTSLSDYNHGLLVVGTMNTTVRLQIPISANLHTVCASLNDTMVMENHAPPFTTRLQEIVDELFGLEPFRHSVNFLVSFPRGPITVANAIAPPSNAPPSLIAEMRSPISADSTSPLQIPSVFSPIRRRGRQFFLLNSSGDTPRGLRRSRARFLIGSRNIATHRASRCSSRFKRQQTLARLRTTACREEFQCSICLNDVEKEETIAMLSCGHKFHRKCMVPWIDAQRDPTCPLCRKPV